VEAGRFPSADEIVARARQRSRRRSLVWSKPERELLIAVRRELGALQASSPPEALFGVLHGLLPFTGGIIETTHASRPKEITNTLYCVPDSFIQALLQQITDNPPMDFCIRLPAGIAFRDIDLIPARVLPTIPLVRAIYPHHGFARMAGLKLSVQARFDDHEHTAMLLFQGTDERAVSWRECRMLEVVHEDIVAAIERMRLPLLPHRSIAFQVMEEQRAGYILLRRDGTMLEVNQRAFSLLDGYASQLARTWADLTEFTRRATRAAAMGDRSSLSQVRSDGLAMLEVSLHKLAKEHHAISEDLTLIELREIPLVFRDSPAAARDEAEGPARPRDALSPRENEIAILLTTSGLSYKQIALELHISEGTVRTHVERIYRAFGVHSRAELNARLSDKAISP